MNTFGDRLRSEREERGLSIESVAEVLRVDHGLLHALERDDFDALPDHTAMMECLSGYADCLEVDAELMIADFVQERDEYLRRSGGGVVKRAGGGARVSPWLVGLVVIAIVTLAGWWVFSRDGSAPERSAATARIKSAHVEAEPVEPDPAEVEPVGPEPAEAERVESGSVEAKPVELAPLEVEPLASDPADAKPADVDPAAVEPSPPPVVTPSAPTAAAPPSLRVPDYGVGTTVENRQLTGRSDRFTEGTRVAFWTRVEGATRGDRVDHVWLRQGVEVTRVPLEIGSSNWRTYSTHTLYSCGAADWAVEARDEAGRLLARSEFVCVR